MTVKITSFEAENVKRVKAVRLEPAPTGLTIIGGDNNQGKTSVLDAIAWALGGNSFKPSNAHRDKAVSEPHLKVVLNNGLVVERKGKNSDLKVTDPTGKKTGQTILNEMIGEIALNIPKFMNASNKNKANYLLQIIGVGDQLKAFDERETEMMAERRYVGQEYRAKKAHANELESYPDAPLQELSASDLIQQQQAILYKNGENAKKRNNLKNLEGEMSRLITRIEDMESQLQSLKNQREALAKDIQIAQTDALDLYDESTEEIEKGIREIDETNQKVRSNRAKMIALKEADDYKSRYTELDTLITNLRLERSKLLDNAPLPLPELSIDHGEILYKGQKWDGMSGSDQLKVSAAICRAMNPNCGFVLMDKLEQMDMKTITEFGQWLDQEGLQAIATRVSAGDECSIIIEDGRVKGEKENDNRSNQNSDLGTAWSW